MAKEDVKLLIGADGQKAISEIQKVTQSMGGLGSGVNNLLSTAGSFMNWQTAAVGAISAAGAAFGKLMVDALNTADEMANMSKRTGVAVESLSRLSYVAKMSDTDMGTLQKSMKFLNTALYDVSKGNQAAIDKFKEFGVEVYNADGSVKNAEQALIATAEAYAKLESDAAKTALATQIFGKAGQELMPMLSEGADGIRQLSEEAEKSGLVISKGFAQAAEEMNDKLDKMKMFAQGVAIQVMEKLVPSINDLNTEMDQFNKDGSAVTKTANSITSVIDFMAFAFNNLTYPMRTVLGLLGDLQEQEKTMDKFTGAWTQSQKIGANANLMKTTYTPTTTTTGGGGGGKGGRGGGRTATGGDTTRIRPRSVADSGFGLADQWWAGLTAGANEMVPIARDQFDFTLQSQLDFIDNSKNAWNGYFDDVTMSMGDYMNVLGDQYADSLGGFASMFEAFANSQAQQQGVMFETARAFRAAEIVASTWTSAQKAYEYGMTFGPWTAGIMMASAIATGVGNLTNLYAAQPGTASINGGGASSAPTPNFQSRNPQGSGGGSSRNITIKFEGFIWDKDKLAREIVPAINRAISDGVGR